MIQNPAVLTLSCSFSTAFWLPNMRRENLLTPGCSMEVNCRCMKPYCRRGPSASSKPTTGSSAPPPSTLKHTELPCSFTPPLPGLLWAFSAEAAGLAGKELALPSSRLPAEELRFPASMLRGGRTPAAGERGEASPPPVPFSGAAGLCRPELGWAGLGRARLGRAGQGWAGLGWAGLSSAPPRRPASAAPPARSAGRAPPPLARPLPAAPLRLTLSAESLRGRAASGQRLRRGRGRARAGDRGQGPRAPGPRLRTSTGTRVGGCFTLSKARGKAWGGSVPVQPERETAAGSDAVRRLHGLGGPLGSLCCSSCSGQRRGLPGRGVEGWH